MKVPVKSGINLVEVFRELAKDLRLDIKDIQTVQRRFSTEGNAFFEKTLPTFGKWFDTCLDNGRLSPIPFFRKKNKGSFIPSFLSGLISRVFDKDSGQILTNPSIMDVFAIRQLSYYFYKIKRTPTALQIKSSSEKFISLNDAVASSAKTLLDLVVNPLKIGLTKEILARAKEHVHSIFGNEENIDRIFKDIQPHSGPGSVAEKLDHHDRLQFSVISRRLNNGGYPYWSYFHSGSADFCNRRSSYNKALRWEQKASRFALVPKDSRGPRLISIEPADYQFIQQGIRDNLVPYLETFPLTRGRLNFTNQLINRYMAMESSKRMNHLNVSYSTVDLKDASDTVSNELVKYLFPERAFSYLTACRTEYIEVRNYTTNSEMCVKTHRFAGMGSALCFPIEAICFYVIGMAAIEFSNVGKYDNPDPLYVYGDDIILPTYATPLLEETLNTCGIYFNRNKTFSAGLFRESCGGEYYDGEDITPARLRTCGTERKDIAALIDHCNLLHEKGLWSTERYYHNLIENLLIPLKMGVVSTSVDRSFSLKQYFSKSTDDIKGFKIPSIMQVFGKTKHRYHRNTQRVLYEGFQPKKFKNLHSDSALNFLHWSTRTKNTDSRAEEYVERSELVVRKYY
jgi:hypothetical protein